MRLSLDYNKKRRTIVIVVSYLLLAIAAAIFQSKKPHLRFGVLKNAFHPGYGASVISPEFLPEEALEIGNLVSSYSKDTRFYLSKDLSASDYVFPRTTEYVYPYRISCDYQYGLKYGCGFGVFAQPTPIKSGSYLVFAKPEESMVGCNLIKNGIKVRLYECPNR